MSNAKIEKDISKETDRDLERIARSCGDGFKNCKQRLEEYNNSIALSSDPASHHNPTAESIAKDAYIETFQAMMECFETFHAFVFSFIQNMQAGKLSITCNFPSSTG